MVELTINPPMSTFFGHFKWLDYITMAAQTLGRRVFEPHSDNFVMAVRNKAFGGVSCQKPMRHAVASHKDQTGRQLLATASTLQTSIQYFGSSYTVGSSTPAR